MASKPKRQKVTMSEIAKQIGVTQATVSHVFNNTGKISDEIQRKVLKTAETLGYEHKAKKTVVDSDIPKNVALLIPDVENSYYAEMAKNVAVVLHRLGYLMVQANTLYEPEYEKSFIHSFNRCYHNKNLMGIIIGYHLADESNLKYLDTKNLPVVFLDSYHDFDTTFSPTIKTDNYLGGRLVAEHLFHLGFNNICVASEPAVGPYAERIRGFSDYMAENNHPIESHRFYIESRQYNKEEMGYNIGARILIDGKIDAIFATSDHVAFGINKRLKEKGIEIPNDVLLAGYDNIKLSTIMTPSLTTVAQPTAQMAEKSADIIHKRILNPDYNPHLIMKPRLIIRDSTLKLPSSFSE